jgi:hypothetical protein
VYVLSDDCRDCSAEFSRLAAAQAPSDAEFDFFAESTAPENVMTRY